MATYNTQQLQEIDGLHHIHPFTDHKALMEKGTRVITRANGVYLWDSDGNKILDGMAGLWCVNVGYGRQELVDAATKQMRELPYYNNFFQTTHPPAIELSKALVDISPPQFNHVFFTNSGSEANDTVVRMVRHYWNLEGKPEKTVIISRENAYHGSTVAASSLGGMKGMHAQGGILHDIEHIEQPHWYKNGGAMDPDEFGLKTAQALETRIREIGEDRVAAFIGEPVQGAGGVIIPPATYWPEIQQICKKYGILLIADEVICGFGRLGEWFGSDYFDIEADFMPIAKGLSSGYLPIGGLMVGDRVADTVINKGSDFNHGFTYSGHPAACAVAMENIRILKDEKIIERAKNDLSPYLQEKWLALGDHPLVGEARGIGMVGALELVKDKDTKTSYQSDQNVGMICRDFCFNNGLIMRAVGDAMIICPPLVISHSEIDELVDKAKLCLDLTWAKIKS
ncbi:MAG TPA: aspartate aminotransferase family protein [Candidatus Marinimicrobia bacterium]|mgnify:FL=1|nr:aspartate aminotransferase family protein [Candidatus Neomarinimicrobiota bacterium]HIC37403.1 aspartate aminotransferase family protein [Candidatus Neomarinimicrobiota bacterium]